MAKQKMSPVEEEGEQFGKATNLWQRTDFESLISVEPMDSEGPHSPLELSFEAHQFEKEEQNVQQNQIEQNIHKKRLSFAEDPDVLHVHEKDSTSMSHENVYDVQEPMDVKEFENDLIDKLDSISVSTVSEYAEESEEVDQDSNPEIPARMDQITNRIFATFLPEDVSAEQRHADLIQAHSRLSHLTKSTNILVINCGESNAQILTTFQHVQNCAFDLECIPDLATFVAFCERSHDWLMVSGQNILLLHTEGHVAQIRMILLLRALTSYYEGSDRFNSEIHRDLQKYTISYPNGLLQSPIGWLRYTDYMRLYSPEHCLSILRATLNVCAISMYSYPVFEENKLRLFFKFYSGSPLRHIHTTRIHDFPGSMNQALRINFSTKCIENSANAGLRLQGNITVMAYHARPYPAKRLRLFILHFHSCQAIAGPLSFQHEHFDYICEAFSSKMRLEFHCTPNARSTRLENVTEANECIELRSTHGPQQIPISQSFLTSPFGILGADDATRHYDSLENISSRQSQTWGSRKMTICRFETLRNSIGDVCWKYNAGKQALMIQRAVNSPVSKVSVNGKHLKIQSEHNENVAALTCSTKLDTTMPPPSAVPKRASKRKQTVGRRLFDLLSGRSSREHSSDAESQDSIFKEVIHSDSSIASSSSTSLKGLFSSFRKGSEKKRRTEPPTKLKKTECGSEAINPVPQFSYTEDILEAARRLNFMAGTQELDRLLEELRLTSMQMTSGLPPTSPNYSPRPHPPSPYTHPHGSRQPGSYDARYQTKSTSSYGNIPSERSPRSFSTGPSNYNYHKTTSSYHAERRLDGMARPAYFPNTYRSAGLSPMSNQRHHSTFTTVLNQRPPTIPKQFSQVHLTIDPECGQTEASHSSSLNDREAIRREQRLESELLSARREIAQLRRAMSLVEERQRSGEYTDDYRSTASQGPRSPSSTIQQNFLSTSTSSYHTTQHNGPRLTSSTFQRSPARNEYSGAFPLTKRAMSHTNVHGSRTWNLRSHLQGSESELAYKRVTSQSNPPGKQGYSAHRERLKQERENELLMRSQRHLAASSTGLNENRSMHQGMQHYRSLSAVNTGALSDTVEEIETIILQPIGRGVQDIDSRTGSMATLARTGGSLMDGRMRTTYPSRTYPTRSHVEMQPRPASVIPPVYPLRARSVSPASRACPPSSATSRISSPRVLAHKTPRMQSSSIRRSMATAEPLQVQIPSASLGHAQPSASEHTQWTTHPSRRSMHYRPNGDVEFAILGTKEIREVTPPPLKLHSTPYGTLPRSNRSNWEKSSQQEGEPGRGEEDGLNRMEPSSQRPGLAGRGYSSTQFLNRTTPTSEIIRPVPVHQSQTFIVPSASSQPLQTQLYGTPTSMSNNIQSSHQLNGSRSQLSTASSTIVADPAGQSNGWKQDQSRRKQEVDQVDSSNLGIVQDTAPAWYRPNLSRDAAIRILRQQAPGSFLIRDSTTFKGAYGLAVKVATLPPKVTPKTDDLQSELVRHYLIEVVNAPTKGVRLKGFASEPVFPSLAALIYRHTYDPLALPCQLILPPVPTHLPSSGSATLPPLVIGTSNGNNLIGRAETTNGMDTGASSSAASMLGRGSNLGSTNQMEGVGRRRQSDDHTMFPMNIPDDNIVASHNVPFVCVLRESPTHQRKTPPDNGLGQGLTFRCLMLGSVDTPQWDGEVCFSRAVDQLIPLTVLTASECDNGISRVRYTEVQLHVSAHDGITIIDLPRRLFLRRHLPNHILVYCGLETRKKEFQHPEHQAHGISHPQIFGIVVRKGISEFTTHIFSECDATHTANAIVEHIRGIYPHLNAR